MTFQKVDISRQAQIATARAQKFLLDNTGLQRLTPEAFEEIPDIFDEGRVATSYLGTPIFSNLTLSVEGNQFVDLEGNTIEIDPLTMNTVLMTVRQTKNIVMTPIQGRNGTVKEYISDGDYVITAVGAIVTEQTLQNFFGNRFPIEEVDALIQLLQAQKELRATSNFLQLFGIDDVVITGYDLPQQQGSREIQPFTINMVSDTAIELRDVETET